MDTEQNSAGPGFSATKWHPEGEEMKGIVPQRVVECQRPVIQRPSFLEFPTQGKKPYPLMA